MKYKISPSTIKLFRECPRCFWLHFHGIKRPANIFPSLPSGMDLIFKRHFDNHRNNNQLPSEINDPEINLFPNQELLNQWRNPWKGLTYETPEGHIIKGAVDEILTKNNQLIVLDYKTRGFPTKQDTPSYYQDQLDIYTFLLQKNGYKTTNYAYLLFYYPLNVVNTKVQFKAELYKIQVSTSNAEELVKQACKILSRKKPPLAKGCKYCEWANFCAKTTSAQKISDYTY